MPLKRPVTLPQARRWPAAAKRRQSFCARMGGMRELLTGERAARDPASPINRALAAWDCDEPELLKREHVSKGIRMKITKGKVGSESRKAPARKNPAKKRTAAQKIDSAPMSSRLDGYGPRKGLEGPFLMRNGRVVYYDPKEGSYYDPTTDIYLSPEESIALMERNPARKNPAKGKTWAVYKVGMKTPVAVFASRADAVKFGQGWADIHKTPVQVIAA